MVKVTGKRQQQAVLIVDSDMAIEEKSMREAQLTIEKIAIQRILRKTVKLQEGMEVLNEDSTNLELKNAYHNHGIVQGYMKCLKDLELMIDPDYGSFFIKQLQIGEKINKLLERRVREKHRG